ncbi:MULTISPECIES: HK97-gp10 family putative phage morphogenesis protein [Clostridium]|jgi:HK97 gp10 family phage protein|uniref:HK97-gp10 family putative phage morphogenesis protein n=1 Tax=Clostridium TaxID=1485 RepID=UPI0018AC5FAD|nr:MULTISPECIES: HK97-gp10 family putative phage morphogenesis protein [Clostridium]MBU6137347.1 HK97 gp10 family phage protein [Clostridium tertium]MDU2683500.1 HK97 gp10 family phage protein [Clostridium sp.]MDU8967567.1 HK97 gp10 family phage protein [Clostridium sp.]HDO9489811.1 HK97 gp10 family phage protein [Clostridioides difficile]
MAIQIKGFDDIFNDLDDMNISDKKKRKALKDGAEIVKQSVIDNSPEASGQMKKRWKSTIKRFDGDLGFEIKGDTVQDIENEFGSSKNKKHIGFFSNAVDKVSDKAVNIIAKEVLK